MIPATPPGRVPVSEILAIDQVATWVSEVVTDSLTMWVKHASEIQTAAGLGAHPGLGSDAASEALRLAVSDLTASLGSWMDSLASRKAAMAARHSDSVGIERALRTQGTLMVHVRSAQGLSIGGGYPPDAFAEVVVPDDLNRRTRAVPGTSKPNWDQTLRFEGQLGSLLKHKLEVRVLHERSKLGEVKLSLAPLLDNLRGLSASWDDLPLEGGEEAGTRGAISIGAVFVPGDLRDGVVLRQPGRLRVHLMRATDVNLLGADDLGCFVRVKAGGTTLDTAPKRGAYSSEIVWREYLEFEGLLMHFIEVKDEEVGDSAQRKVEVELRVVETAEGRSKRVASAPVHLANTRDDLDEMVEEVGGKRTVVTLSDGSKVTLAYEWLEQQSTPVSEELHALYPLLRSTLEIRRLKRDTPLEIFLSHPAARKTFRTYLDMTSESASAGARAVASMDLHKAIEDHRALCDSAQARSDAGESSQRVLAASAETVFQGLRRTPDADKEKVRALAEMIAHGRISGDMFESAQRDVRQGLDRDYARFTQSAYFTELLHGLSARGPLQGSSPPLTRRTAALAESSGDAPSSAHQRDHYGQPDTSYAVDHASTARAREALKTGKQALEEYEQRRLDHLKSTFDKRREAYDKHIKHIKELHERNEAQLRQYRDVLAQDSDAAELNYFDGLPPQDAYDARAYEGHGFSTRLGARDDGVGARSRSGSSAQLRTKSAKERGMASAGDDGAVPGGEGGGGGAANAASSFSQHESMPGVDNEGRDRGGRRSGGDRRGSGGMPVPPGLASRAAQQEADGDDEDTGGGLPPPAIGGGSAAIGRSDSAQSAVLRQGGGTIGGGAAVLAPGEPTLTVLDEEGVTQQDRGDAYSFGESQSDVQSVRSAQSGRRPPAQGGTRSESGVRDTPSKRRTIASRLPSFSRKPKASPVQETNPVPGRSESAGSERSEAGERTTRWSRFMPRRTTREGGAIP